MAKHSDDQPSLWSPVAGPTDPHALTAIDPIDPNVNPADVKRLSRQCEAILHMLRIRPHTNDELAAVSRKYTSRISDIRAAGHKITYKRLSGGLTLYTLEN